MNGANDNWKRAALQGGLGPVLVVAILIAYLENAFNLRPDPQELRLEIEGKIEAAEQRIIDRIIVGERRLEQSFLVQQQIWEAIGELPPDEFEEEVEDIERRLKSLEIHTIRKDKTYQVPE